MTKLFIDCCVRGEKSATRRYAEAWMRKNNVKPEILRLSELELRPYLASDIEKRDALLAAGRTDDEMFAFARRFREADEIIIAAPYWDLSFPSLLKVYFEKVSVCGITFVYEGTRSVGCCKAECVRYFSTCGGFTGGFHHGVEYTRALCGMFGINKVIPYTIEGMDIDWSKREDLLDKAIFEL